MTPYQKAETKAKSKLHYYAKWFHNGREAVKLNTVNVIEITNGSDLQSIHSFADNDDGNRAAEKLFKRFVRRVHPVIAKGRLNEMIDDGYLDTVNYWVGITHSV